MEASLTQILTEYAEEGILVLNNHGIIVHTNTAFSKIFEVEGPFKGKTIYECFLEKDGFEEVLDYIFSVVYEQGVVKKKVINCNVNGKKKVLLGVASRFVHETHKGILLIITDISDYNKLQEALGKYISPVLAEKVINDPSALEVGGELRKLSVIMSDLRGFTAMSEKLTPNELITMLNHYFAAMTKVIKEYKGTVIEFVGDGIVAIFGVPIDNIHHATYAVHAALAMQDEMKKVNEWNIEKGYPQLSMGVSISTGEAVVGNIGCEDKMEYDVIGRDINLCGRLEGITSGGEIIISEETYKQCEKANARFDEGTDVRFKGIAEPVKVYRVLYNDSDQKIYKKGDTREIKFNFLQQKTVATNEIRGELKFVSAKRAFLKTDYKLNVYDNICITEKGEAYAKVIGVIDGGYILDFTYISDALEQDDRYI